MAALHGDMSVRVDINTNEMEWTSSPSGRVLRKRLHLVGEAESGQVTSLVRYEPDSSFPEHGHPEGEEIFVLEGTFSDHLGDATAGTHLLNPEGFRHAPYSEEGCLIFVKLRQYDEVDGERRPYRRTRVDQLVWKASGRPGVEQKVLFEEAGFPDVTRLERWAPGAAPGTLALPGGAEILVIDGEWEDEGGCHGTGSWTRLPAERSSGLGANRVAPST